MESRIPLTLAVALAILAPAPAEVGAASGPIRVSPNGRYFVDAQGEPFYFLADTQWELFRRYSLSEAKTILENRKAKGFTVIMVMLTGVGSGTGPNLDGHHPWLNDDPATPNPDYFTHVDAVVRLAQANDLQLLIGIYHQTYGRRMTVDNAEPWAAWVTRRYRDVPNIIWTIYPRATDSYRATISKLAEGIQTGDGGRHLVSLHPDPSPASSSFLHAEPWLGFDSIQVWNQLGAVYPMTTADYRRTPPKPVAMLEGVYEGGEEYGYPITPLLVRREAYYTCLAGGFHGYGHNDSWRVKPRWRAALDGPGAQQMTVLKSFFTSLPAWWTLVPDQSLFVSGGIVEGDVLNLGACSAEGKWAIAYIAGEPRVLVDLAKLNAAPSASAEWVDPITGDHRPIGRFPSEGTQSFTRPADWQDALLVLKAVEGPGNHLTRPAAAAQGPETLRRGPLRVHPANPRYFTDASERAILLTGSHTWGNLQDYQYATLPSPRRDRNHPSVILWSAENEGLNVSALTPAMLEEFRRIIDAADGSRPVIFDGDGTAFGASPASVKHYVKTIEDLQDRGGRSSGYAKDLRNDIYWATAYHQQVPLGCGEFLFPYEPGLREHEREVIYSMGLQARGYRLADWFDTWSFASWTRRACASRMLSPS